MKNALLMSVLIISAGCEAPPVNAGSDTRQNQHRGRIEGNVVVSSSTKGKVVVLLFDAARPPPPVGTGRPLNFTVISRETIFGSATAADVGPFTAPFTFSLVPAGSYLIRGFVDANDDFIPWYSVTAEVNRGDLGGAAVDPLTRANRDITVTVDADGNPSAVTDVPVAFSDAALVPVDRPVFEIPAGIVSVTLTNTPITLEVQSRAIDTALIKQSRPGFLVRFVDDDNDGVPDDANHDGSPEVWPRVFVRKIASNASVLLDENDLDKNGVLDATGVDYEHINPQSGATIAADGQPDLVVLAAGFDVRDIASSLLDLNGKVKTTPTVVTSLKLIVQPRAIDASNPASAQVLKAVPSGKYAVTIMQSTGQTWRLPNELSPDFAERFSLPSIQSQSFVIEVP